MKAINTTCTTSSNVKTNFTQAFDHVMCDGSQSYLARLLYCRIARFVDNGKDAFPSLEWLAEEFDSNVSQIGRELRKLSAAGLINKTQRGLNKSNVYTVNPWPMDVYNKKVEARKARGEFIIEEAAPVEVVVEVKPIVEKVVETVEQPIEEPTPSSANTVTVEKEEVVIPHADKDITFNTSKPSKRIDFGVKTYEEEDIYGLF